MALSDSLDAQKLNFMMLQNKFGGSYVVIDRLKSKKQHYKGL